MSKVVCLMAFFLMLIPLVCSCSENQESYAYQYTAINPKLIEGDTIATYRGYCSIFTTWNHNFGVVGSYTTTETAPAADYKIKVRHYNLYSYENSSVEMTPLPLDANDMLESIVPTSDNGYIILISKLIEKDDFYTTSYFLCQIDMAGNLLFKLDNTAIPLSSSSSIAVSSSDTFFVLENSSITALSKDGTILYTLNLPEDQIERVGFKATVERHSDGHVYLGYYTRTQTGTAYRYRLIDETRQTMDDFADFPVIGENSTPFFGGGDYPIYYTDSLGLYGVKLGSEPEMLLMWTDVGLSKNMIETLIIADDQTIYVELKNDAKDVEIGMIQKVNAKEIAQKQILTIAYDTRGADGSMSELLNYIGLFNRNNANYSIKLTGYTADEKNGLSVNQQLANDMAAGHAPDIVMFNGSFSYEIFEKKDTFVDLYALMDADPEYGRNAFLPCVLTPFESANGELTSLVTEFSFMTLTGKKSLLGDRDTWTIAEMADFAQTLDTDQAFTTLSNNPNSGDERLSFLKLMLSGALGQFIDYDNASCDFSDDFRLLLEFCGKTKSYKGNDSLDPSVYINEKVLLSTESYRNLIAYALTRHLTFADNDLTYIGFPVDAAASGTIIVPGVRFAITKQSQSTAAAWEFMTFYLTMQSTQWDQIESNSLTYMPFPCTVESFDAMFCAAKALQIIAKITYSTDAQTNEQQVGLYYSTVPYDETDNPLREDAFLITDDDIASLRQLLDTVTQTYIVDDASVAIILEEASAYYAGTATLDETVARITDRINTRLNE